MKAVTAWALAFSLLIIAALSCKKSSGSSKSHTTYLTQSSWKIQSLGVDANKDGTVDYDITSSLPACQLDNIYTFKSDGTGTTDEGATKCNSTDPQTTPFTWAFKSNETILSGNFGISNGDANIATLNDTNFVLWRDSTYSGNPVRIYLTLKH
jgi:hypothetical protein